MSDANESRSFQPTWQSMAAIIVGAFLIGFLGNKVTCDHQTDNAVSGEQP